MQDIKEERQLLIPRNFITTANLPVSNRHSEDSFIQTYSFGINPRVSFHNRKFPNFSKKNNSVLHSEQLTKISDIVNSPFKRIKRVERIIFQQKNQNKESSLKQEEYETLSNSYVLKPQFKIKTRKHQSLKNHHQMQYQAEESNKLIHLKNISLELKNSIQQKDEARPSILNNNYQQNLKNRIKLTKKSPKKKPQTSLLQMLNRISETTPLHRYKSKAFDSARKVNIFISNL